MKIFLGAFLVSLALLFGSLSATPASAHRAQPAWRCHTQISVLLAAISTHNNADTGAAAAALAACEGVSSVAPSVPSNPFGYDFPNVSYGYNPFGYNYFGYPRTSFGFTPNSFGFGLGTGAYCPSGSGLVLQSPLPDAVYACQFGRNGFGVTPICGGQYHLNEQFIAPEPVYQCVL